MSLRKKPREPKRVLPLATRTGGAPLALTPKPKMNERSLAAQLRRGGLSKLWATPRGQQMSVWACEALECGSLLPLSSPRAGSRGFQPKAQIPASKLARANAAASCRTPKLRRHVRLECDVPNAGGRSHAGPFRAGTWKWGWVLNSRGELRSPGGRTQFGPTEIERLARDNEVKRQRRRPECL